MNWAWALEQLKAGRCVKQATWCCVWIDPTNNPTYRSGLFGSPEDDVDEQGHNATDWELAPPWCQEDR